MSYEVERIEDEDYGLTARLLVDEDCESPRQYSNVGKFLGFPHRHYNIGDETFDPERHEIDCEACHGTGYADEDETEECPECEGRGSFDLDTWERLEAYVRAEYGARVVLMVSMTDHSGVSYYEGRPRDPWDSGVAGVMFDTPEGVSECMGDGASDEQIAGALRCELEEYGRWASGECYGYVIEDEDGDTLDSCWGFIGFDYAKETAEEALEACRAHARRPKAWTSFVTL